jgi:hypothetical protein
MGRLTTYLLVIPLLAFHLAAFTPSAANADSSSEDQWRFNLAPYAWLAGQKGSVATLPPLPPVDVDIGFWDDILGNINGALFLVGEARKEKYGVLFDIAYADIELENATPGPIFSSVISRTKSWIVSAVGSYRLVEKPNVFGDLLVGIRYWSVDSTLGLKSAILRDREVSNREDWLDPIIGLKGQSFLGSSPIFVNGGLLIGGFGAGSDFMWDANFNLGYRWTETFSTTLGYRYLDVDYEKDDFLYDVSQDGPVLGLSWVF